MRELYGLMVSIEPTLAVLRLFLMVGPVKMTPSVIPIIQMVKQ
jgi:hypothetical protein